MILERIRGACRGTRCLHSRTSTTTCKRRRSHHRGADGTRVHRHLRLHHYAVVHVDALLRCLLLLLQLILGQVENLEHVQTIADWSRGQLLDLMQGQDERLVSQVVMLEDEGLVHRDEG